ncbi:MAG: aldehyde dehydrogenase family protein [Bdellovibrionota bacterium]
MEVLNFINGEFVKTKSLQMSEKFDPFTGKSMGSAGTSDVMDLVQAIQGAKAVLADLEKMTYEKRAEKLKIGSEVVFRNAALWAAEEARFQGLPQSFVETNIIIPAAELLKKISNDLLHATSETRPVGLVAVSVPWGASFLLAIERIAPALAAGNAVILHLSTDSFCTLKMVSELVKQAEWPKGSLQIILGPRKEIVPLLAGHPGIAAFSYVGHEKHRDKIIQMASSSGKRIQMSLSAKNSLIFLEEPPSAEDLLEKLRPCLVGMGQNAWNTHRIFILESFRPSFLEKLKLALSDLKPAVDQTSPELSLWPLIDPLRIESLQKLRTQIPTDEGKVFWGGESFVQNGGYFVQPLFSIDLSNCSTWQQEDLRLPYFIVTSVKYSHEIAKWNNTGSFGHSAVIWGPEDKARSLGQKLQVGQVMLNKWKISMAHDFVPQKLSREGIPDYRWDGHFFTESCSVI